MRRRRFNKSHKFEKLENRWMMAADIDLSNDVLTINGTSEKELIIVQPTTIYEYDNDGELEGTEEGVRVTMSNRSTGEPLLDETFERDRIDLLEVFSRDGDDWIENRTDIPGILDGGLDDDVIFGGEANDTIVGDEGDDIIFGREGTNHLYGGIDDDTYYFGSTMTIASDIIHEDPSLLDDDTLHFGFLDLGPVTVDLANTEWQTVVTNYLELQITSATGIENVVGTNFGDTIYGNSRDNDLEGSDGNDKLYGRTGNDALSGGDDNDLLVGAEGNDTLNGGAHDDTYFFGGIDLGIDEISEAPDDGVDTLDFSGMKHYGLTIDLTKYGSRNAVESPYLTLNLNNDSAIENVIGTIYDDTITGNRRDNTLSGGRGNDIISGGIGADILKGGDGADQLRTDELDEAFGGLGLDRFDLVYEFEFRPNPRRERYKDWGLV